MKEQKDYTIGDLNTNFETAQEANSCLMLIDYIKAAVSLVYNSRASNIEISQNDKVLLKSKIDYFNNIVSKLI